MHEHDLHTKIALWVNRGVALLVFALLFFLPAILRWYCSIRMLAQLDPQGIMAAFYCCAAVIFVALWNIERLMKSILALQVFTRENVLRIRRIQWCCGGVSLLCVPASVCYLPLVFLVVIMAFACLMVSVVARVMDKAVAIREENDLTI
jgi:hypothetical protein